MSDREPSDAHLDAIADAYPHPYWYDDVDKPESNPMLVRTETCDLCVVGGGYTGLWTAIIAKERDPSRDVVLVEGASVGSAASGRNGGFMESSLTHGVSNGQERFPDEMPALERLGLDNLNQIESAIERYGIDCDYERTGVIDVAIEEPMVIELRADAEHLHALGQDVELLD
jgi:glycine/D-amino acid oxidase-like deaminating enzyme